jgi:AraC-like DNA-binding protein
LLIIMPTIAAFALRSRGCITIRIKAMLTTLLTWLDDSTYRLRISRVLRDDATVLHAETPGEFREMFVERGDVNCTLIDSRSAAAASSLVNYVSAHRPDVAIIGVADFGMEHVTSFGRVAKAGAHRLLFRSAEQTRASMRAHIADAARACAMQQVLARIEPLLPARAIPLLRCFIDISSEPMSVESAASVLGLSRRTLLRNCTASHVIPPAALFTWCRLVLVEYLLLHTPETVESLAFEAGFPSGPALRNALRRHAGVSATKIRNGGSATPVFDRFRSAMRDARIET